MEPVAVVSWADLVELEDAQILGDVPRTVQVGVSEHAPTQTTADSPGRTTQSVMLMVVDGERLDPPLRLLVRGSELRVLGTQVAPFTDGPSLVTCERVNPDLPDEVVVVEETGPAVLDVTDAVYVTPTATLWAGAAHIVSGVPSVVDSGGEDMPLDKVTITMPQDAPYREGLRVDVTTSRTPGLVGASFKLSGEILDSATTLRRVVGYRPGV